ncbi:hypothetical protein AAHN93_12600 [Vandammella animalimorsus]
MRKLKGQCLKRRKALPLMAQVRRPLWRKDKEFPGVPMPAFDQ